MNQNGVQILLQSLEKKNQILDQLVSHIELQEELLKQEAFPMDRLNQMLDEQGRLVEALEQLDQGFESVYDRTREEIVGNKEKYRTEIKRMQECIQQITAKIATVNAGNMRNNALMESQFKKQKRAINQSISMKKVARNYYNNMNKLNHVSPVFYDSKK